MTAPPAEVRTQDSELRSEGRPNRTPFLIAGAVLAALFGWQSCLSLLREPTHAKASLAEDDYPLEQGLTWVYKAPMGLQVVRRAKMTFMSPGYELLMEYELPMLGTKTLPMRRTPEGVMARRDEREQIIMRFPMKPGDSWTIDFPTEDLAECAVLEPETINVLGKPATASKLRVVRTNRKNGKKTTDYEWYVRGIGLARMEVTFGLKATFELERFEKAK